MGDYLQIGKRLHMVIGQDVDSDDQGDATINIWPSIHEAPNDGDPIIRRATPPAVPAEEQQAFLDGRAQSASDKPFDALSAFHHLGYGHYRSCRRNRVCTRYRYNVPMRFVGQPGNIVDAPILCYAGRMDQPTILEGTDTSTISISVENRLADLQRRIERRFTDRDQRLQYPADTGVAYVAWTMDWNGAWTRLKLHC